MAAAVRVGSNGATQTKAKCCRDVVPLQFGRLYFSEDRSASIATEGGYGRRSRCVVTAPRHYQLAYKGALMDGIQMAVFTTNQLVDAAAVGGGGRWRRRPQVPSYSWHLIHPERPLTWCGLEFSYAYSRRLPWSETPEDQRCQSCFGRLERVSHIDMSQRVAPSRGEVRSDRA